MKKGVSLVTVILVIIIAIVISVFLFSNNKKEENDTNTQNSSQTDTEKKPTTVNLNITKTDDLKNLISNVYESIDLNSMPRVETNEVDLADNDVVKSFTGLENGNEIEFLAVSEPLMSSQAYSFVLLKVKDGVDANSIAKTMSENIDTRKWICVEAEKLYATSYNDIVCLVMGNEETATNVYNSFKNIVKTVGEEYEKTNSDENIELSPDMY